MATGSIKFDPGTTENIAVYDITEDAVTKHLNRSVLAKSDGTEIGTSATPVEVNLRSSTVGVATAAKQPAIGTAGTASTDVITIQGIASMTAVKVDGSGVTQPVSGTVTANAGTGNFASTIADGSDVTLGAKADARSTATDTTAVTAMQVLKEISFMEQNPASQAVTNAGTFATQPTIQTGTNSIGKITDITASVVPGTAATNLGKAEDAAHSSGDTGVFALGVRNDALSAFSGTDLDYTPIAVTAHGRVLVTPAPSAAMTRGTATTTGTGDTSLVAASGNAGLKTYITNVQIANTGSTTSLITFKDGSGGATLGYTIAPTGGGSNIYFEIPLVTTANTAFYFAAASASTTIYASAQGYLAP